MMTLTNELLDKYVYKIQYYGSLICDALINLDRHGDIKFKNKLHKLAHLTLIQKSLENYDVDSDVLSNDEINQLLYDANDICTKLANNSIYD